MNEPSNVGKEKELSNLEKKEKKNKLKRLKKKKSKNKKKSLHFEKNLKKTGSEEKNERIEEEKEEIEKNEEIIQELRYNNNNNKVFPIFIMDDDSSLNEMFFKILKLLTKIVPIEYDIKFFLSTNKQINKFIEEYDINPPQFSAYLKIENLERNSIFIRSVYNKKFTKGYEDIKIEDIDSYITKEIIKNNNIIKINENDKKIKILKETINEVKSCLNDIVEYDKNMDELLFYLKKFISLNKNKKK